MSIVAKCPISLKMTPLKGKGCILVPVSQFKFVGLAWPLALNISFCLRTLSLSINQSPSLIQVCACESFKKHEMAENLVFRALPLVLGVPNFDGKKDQVCCLKDGTDGVVSTASTTTSNPLSTLYCYDISGSNDRGG